LYCDVGGKQEETIKSDVTGEEDKRKEEKLKLGTGT
jgi:hypothetical protein